MAVLLYQSRRSVCLSVMLSTIESFDLESSYLVHGYIYRVFRSRSYLDHPVKVKVIISKKHVSVSCLGSKCRMP